MSSTSLPKTLFHQLQGRWKLDRTLSSSNASEPSGKCFGFTNFTPRPVSKAPDHEAVEEMLYEEHGDFEINLPPTAGYTMPRLTFSRKYIWRLGFGEEPNITVWFAKPGTEELDYLFHELDLKSKSAAQNTPSTQAHGSHLCVQDQYETDYSYDINHGQENSLHQWRTSHTVKGPKKDQVIRTTFTRASKSVS